MGRAKGTARRHKNGTGNLKAQPAARKLTAGGHKHMAVVGAPKPRAKRASAPRTPVEEPPFTGEHHLY